MNEPPPPDFFCFGPPKSGTTMLQRMLSLHPQVSCPSEHHFRALLELFRQGFAAYNAHLALRDRWTGAQGATPIGPETQEAVWAAAVARIVRDAGAGKPICGANDNELMEKPELIAGHFPRSRLIAIFRHPLDQAHSAWHALHRLAEREEDPRHLALLERHGDFAGWARFIARRYVVQLTLLLRTCRAQPLLLLRYEAVCADPQGELGRVFAFLGAACDAATLAAIAETSRFDRARAASADPGFFHRGPAGYEAPAALRREVEGLAGAAMRRLGYRL